MLAGFIEIAEGVWKHPSAVVDVEALSAGAGTVINAHARLIGTRVSLGREAWIDEYALIGGGSAYDPLAFLEAGHWLHMGMFSQINTARGVVVGDEVGIGIGTRLFTHGAYLSEWDGFPVEFHGVRVGSRVWLPHAQVNPGVEIGDDVVVAAGSLVSGKLPAGCLAGGIPARIIRAGLYPRPLEAAARTEFLASFSREVESIYGIIITTSDASVRIDDTKFDLDARTIVGPINQRTEQVKNQLRRRGIRFPFGAGLTGEYERWK